MKKFLLVLVALVLAFPSFGQSEKSLKRKVAIGRFSNETQYAKGIFYDREKRPHPQTGVGHFVHQIGCQRKVHPARTRRA